MADGPFDVYLIKAKPDGRQSTVEYAGSPNPTLTTGICLSDLERTTCDSLAPSPVAQIVKYPSSSVLINTPGVASAVVNRNEAVWKGSPPATETVTSSSLSPQSGMPVGGQARGMVPGGK